MKKFYAITAYEGGDNSVIAVTDSKKKAKHIKYLYDHGNNGGVFHSVANITEFPTPLQNNQAYYLVDFYSSGETEAYVFFKDYSVRSLNTVDEHIRGAYKNYSVYVMAENKESAIEIASDLVAQYKTKQNNA